MKYLIRRLFILSIFILSSSLAIAQQSKSVYNIQGTIFGVENVALAGAGIKLTALQTGEMISSVTNTSGNFMFTNLKVGRYGLKVSYTGLEDYSSTIEVKGDTTLKNIILSYGKNTSLEEITVAASPPQIEQKGDRLVVNVDANPVMAGNSVLEILGKSPGISVGAEGSISMKGRQGVMVMINDKPIRLSGNELTEFLRGISAANISKLELINNPPAKYEASGASGIINIKLKKDLKSGLNGNVSLNNGSGKYLKTNNGGNISLNKDKLNLSANYNYSNRSEFLDMDIKREFLMPVTGNGLFSQDYYQKNTYATHSSRLSADYRLNKKINLGSEFFGNFTTIDREADSKSLKDGITETAFNTVLNRRKSYGANLNSGYKLDTLGSALNADVDYSQYDLDDVQDYNINSPLINSGNPLLLFNDGRGKLKIKSAALNYLGMLKNGLKLETGLKAVSVKSGTELDFFNRTNGTNIYDENLSSRFTYQENIQAAFVSMNSKTRKLDLQAGLRYEATATAGSQYGIASFKRNYHQLFPSASINYHLRDNHSIAGAFSRRVQRPSYSQINPFFYFLDLSTRFAGNPELKPATSYSSELSYTFKNKYILSAGYFVTRDEITDIQIQDVNEPEVLIQQPVNIDRYKVYSLNAYIPLKIFSALNSTNSLGLYKSIYTGIIGLDRINNSRPYLMASSVNNLIIKSWSIQLTGSYEGKQFYGNTEVAPITILSLGFQKKILSKQGTLSLNFNDPLRGNKINSIVSTSQYSNSLLRTRDSRAVIFGFSWRFGTKPKALEKKSSSADEEKRRAG